MVEFSETFRLLSDKVNYENKTQKTINLNEDKSLFRAHFKYNYKKRIECKTLICFCDKWMLYYGNKNKGEKILLLFKKRFLSVEGSYSKRRFSLKKAIGE